MKRVGPVFQKYDGPNGHPYSTVILDTWYDENRIPDLVGGKADCPHLGVDKGLCVRCHGFVGYVGSEENPIHFYNHIYTLARTFYPASDLYVISERPVPEDFNLKCFGQTLWFPHRRRTLYLASDKVYLHLFLTRSRGFEHGLHVFKKDFKSWFLQDSKLSLDSLLFVNPKEKDLVWPCDYVIANEVFRDRRVWESFISE